MIPAYLMGLNIFRLRSDILNFLNNKKKIFLKDSVIKLANLLEQRKIKNIIFLNCRRVRKIPIMVSTTYR